MKEYVELMARYNSIANQSLYEIAGKLPDELLKKDVGTYYKSIFGLLNHILSGDLLWLNRFRNSFREHQILQSPAVDFDIHSFRTGLYSEFEPLLKRRQTVDSLILEWAGLLTEETLQKTFEYSNIRGQTFRFIVWQALAHVFNHQTHHRGVISAILDQMDIENDYSGITNIL